LLFLQLADIKEYKNIQNKNTKQEEESGKNTKQNKLVGSLETTALKPSIKT